MDDGQWQDTHFFGQPCHGQEAKQAVKTPLRHNSSMASLVKWCYICAATDTGSPAKLIAMKHGS